MIDLKKIRTVNKKRITASLSDELYDEFSSICRKEKVKKNDVLKWLIYEFCEKYKKEKKVNVQIQNSEK